MSEIELSILIPVCNEAGNVGPLHEQLSRVLRGMGCSYEILFVDDGSTDATLEQLERIVREDSRVRVMGLRRNFGKSAALAVGFREVCGARVITMDGDLQDDPEEIPDFLAKLGEGFDMVSGWKRTRHDPVTKRWPSRIFNLVTSATSGVRLHDFNCGFKAYRREVVKAIRIYGELHRFIPVLANQLGFRVGEKEVRHHPRQRGESKYGAARFINGFLDLLTVMFLGTSRKSPLHVFGRVGVLLFVAGMAICLYMFGIWIVESALRVRPLLIGGVILLILGIQFVSMGLIAEMVVSTRREEDEHLICRRLP